MKRAMPWRHVVVVFIIHGEGLLYYLVRTQALEPGLINTTTLSRHKTPQPLPLENLSKSINRNRLNTLKELPSPTRRPLSGFHPVFKSNIKTP
jgi:hypothetical protein